MTAQAQGPSKGTPGQPSSAASCHSKPFRRQGQEPQPAYLHLPGGCPLPYGDCLRGVACRQVGSGAKGRESPPERRVKARRLGIFHKEGFLQRRLGMQNQGFMCSIRVCSLQMFGCYLSHGIRITQSGIICQNNVETQCPCLQYAQGVKKGCAFVFF